MQLVASTMNYKSCKLLKGSIIYPNYQTPTTLTHNNDFKGLHVTYHNKVEITRQRAQIIQIKDVQPNTKLKPNTQNFKSIEISHVQAT
jgi:hypothetical protein